MKKYRVLTKDGRCIYSGTDYEEAIYQRDEYNYEYGGGAKVHTCKVDDTKETAVRMAKTALNQIIATTDANIICSWGVSGWGAGWIFNENGCYLPCLILDVSGLIHTGRVIIAYNEGSDVYEVALYDAKGNRKGDWHTDVYCDELGSLIDSLVERPKGMSDEDYKELSELDSFYKMVFE